MHETTYNSPIIDHAGIRARHLLALPASWVVGIVSLQAFSRVLPDSLAFYASAAGAILGILLLYVFFLKSLDKRISLSFVLLVFFAKLTFMYLIWSHYVFAPCEGGDLEVTGQSGFGEAYHYWMQINKVVGFWSDNGFTLVFPAEYYINLDHPKAMLLIALPYTALPLFYVQEDD